MKTTINLAFSALLMTTTAVAQENIALVISNSDYRMIPSVAEAHDHALTMVQGLEEKGFAVTFVHNMTLGFHNFTFDAFQSKLQAAEAGSVGVVYFAGHGLSQDGTNYILPIDVAPGAVDTLTTTAIDVASLTVDLGADPSKQAYVVIDCCTTNPLDPKGAGLVAMTPPAGNRVVFARPAGEVLAADGSFTQDLITALMAPDATLASALDAVDPTMPAAPAPVVAQPATVAETQSAPPEEDAVVATAATIAQAEPVAELAPAEIHAAAPDVIADAAPEADPVAPEEVAAWEALKGTAGSSELLVFLGQFPDGAFADEAKDMLVQVLAAEQSAAVLTIPAEDITAPGSDVATEIAAVTPTDTAATEPVAVSFATPLVQGDPAIVGKTIAELIKGSPLFPPVEGLPESFWKDQTCSACHAWDEANLCAQANTYLTEAGSVNLTKQHPYGGTFKQNIRDWAIGGCAP